MTRRAVLVPTSYGPVGSVVHEPDTKPAAIAVVLSGRGTHAGINRIQTRLGDALAGEGFVVLRPGHASRGDSKLVDLPREQVDATIEAVRSFRRRAGELDLVVVARCYGLIAALQLAAEEAGPRGVLLWGPGFGKWERVREEMSSPLLARVKRIARRFGWRSGPPKLPQEILGMLNEATDRTNLAFLLGGRGPRWEREALQAGLPQDLRDKVTVDVVEGAALQPHTLEEQRLIIELIRSRARGLVDAPSAISPSEP